MAAAAVEALIGNGDLIEGGVAPGSRPETPVTPTLNGDVISELLSGCSTPDSEKLSLSDAGQDFALESVLLGPKGPRNTGAVGS